MTEEPQRREERPGGGARLQTKDLERPKDTPEVSELEAAVVTFASVSPAGTEADLVLPNGETYHLTRTELGVWTQPWDEALVAARQFPEDDAQRFRAAVVKAKVDAAHFLMANGDAADRRLAARFLFGVPRRSR